jgi:ATP/maltotriose-dependent transcriptional regulator MalT
LVRDFGLAEVLALTRDHRRLLNLSSADHRRPLRQRTIKASLDWSFQRVTSTERTLLARLALLEGSWTLGDAQRVGVAAGIDGAAVPEVLGILIARSLIGIERGEESIRYRLNRTLRQYALDHCTAPELPRGLTARELQVLSLLARGYSNKEISSELAISYGTARIHVEHILNKLNVRSRTQAALWAVHRDGLPTGGLTIREEI